MRKRHRNCVVAKNGRHIYRNSFGHDDSRLFFFCFCFFFSMASWCWLLLALITLSISTMDFTKIIGNQLISSFSRHALPKRLWKLSSTTFSMCSYCGRFKILKLLLGANQSVYIQTATQLLSALSNIDPVKCGPSAISFACSNFFRPCPSNGTFTPVFFC